MFHAFPEMSFIVRSLRIGARRQGPEADIARRSPAVYGQLMTSTSPITRGSISRLGRSGMMCADSNRKSCNVLRPLDSGLRTRQLPKQSAITHGEATGEAHPKDSFSTDEFVELVVDDADS